MKSSAIHKPIQEIYQPFRELIEHIAIGLIMTDSLGNLLEANLTFCDVTGYSRAELVKMSIKNIFHSDDLPTDINVLFQNILHHSSEQSFEARCIRKDQKVIWVKLSFSLFEDTVSHQSKYVVTVQDISQQKITEENLEESRNDWKRIFHAIGHPSLLLDKNHVIQDVNHAVVMSLGLKREEIIGQSCYTIFHSSQCSHPTNHCPMESLLKTRESKTVEIEMEALGGKYLVSCTPLFDKKGELKNIIHIATDITHLKHTEQDLMESESRYRALLDSAPVGIAVHYGGKVAFANQTACDMFGIPDKNQVEGRSIFEFVHPSNLQTTIERIKRVMAGESGLYPVEKHDTSGQDCLSCSRICHSHPIQRKTQYPVGAG